MTVIRSLLLLAAAACIGSAADFNGTWKAVFTGPPEDWPKAASEMVFHLRTEGNRLSGTAQLGGVGNGPVTDGRAEGSRFIFTVQTQNVWRNGDASGWHTSGLPKLIFIGTLRDGELEIHLVWDSVMLYGDAPVPREFTMHGVRVETAAR